MMFRRLPAFGGDPRAVAEIVNNIMNGKTNNTGLVTLDTGNASTTTLVDERISEDTKIVLIPFSAEAFDDSLPYGQVSDNTDQTATTIGDANILSFSTEDFSNGVYLSNSNRINVRNNGIYAVQFSIQLANTTNDVQDVDIWFRKNASDVASSNSRFGIKPRKSSGAASHVIAATMIFLELNANDYIQIIWRPTDVGVNVEHFGAVTASAGVTPAIPATPSVFVTIQYIAPFAYSNVYVSSQTKGEATISHFSNNVADKTYAYILVG